MSIAKILTILMILLLMAGCATNGDISRLEKEINSVRIQASNAEQIAEQAAETAAEAKKAADEANFRSKSTEEMVNRGFKKSMYK